MTYAIEAVAVLVGLFGLSSSVGAIVLARRREFGMLRHLGMTRRADRRDARGRGRPARAARRRRGPRARRRDQPGADPRRQPPVVQLEHGPAPAVPALLGALSLLLVLLSSLTALLSGREAMGMAPGARGEGGLVNRREFLGGGHRFPARHARPRAAFSVRPRRASGLPHEWWYVTGWLKTARGEDLGFQITFFRTRLRC